MGPGGVVTSGLSPADLLIDTVEVLGAHSIRTGELKQLIGCLRPLESDKLVSELAKLPSVGCELSLPLILPPLPTSLSPSPLTTTACRSP